MASQLRNSTRDQLAARQAGEIGSSPHTTTLINGHEALLKEKHVIFMAEEVV